MLAGDGALGVLLTLTPNPLITQTPAKVLASLESFARADDIKKVALEVRPAISGEPIEQHTRTRQGRGLWSTLAHTRRHTAAEADGGVLVSRSERTRTPLYSAVFRRV